MTEEHSNIGLNRRHVLFGAASLAALTLAGCTSMGGGMSHEEALLAYGPLPKERFPVPAVNLNKVDPRYLRRTVAYKSSEAPGTIIVDPGKFYVYRIEGNGMATRYGANVGRAGFLWNGDAYIGRKAEWPVWTPPREMIARQPEVAKYAGGMAPGLYNPLGARVLYLYQDGRYTLYTIYSTIMPETIGKNITSGCVGLLTQDAKHLFDQTPVGTKVVVLKA
ncbi:L,D-transpeptidase [Devosia sp. MC521]|uniref:L,D-transpeptidase n=1 Tax=Devosia sp. MC521 TaxID=2759954 RepID=UPI0015FB87A2|nr:L,D-transpeptidase [Devosia sp. MC521]MBJ6985831.1 L,D-transpeptidase [Devosia sp. MC521]QMW61209.1 L,D-transpeptidase [Devosia sp. MC521]